MEPSQSRIINQQRLQSVRPSRLVFSDDCFVRCCWPAGTHWIRCVSPSLYKYGGTGLTGHPYQLRLVAGRSRGNLDTIGKPSIREWSRPPHQAGMIHFIQSPDSWTARDGSLQTLPSPPWRCDRDPALAYRTPEHMRAISRAELSQVHGAGLSRGIRSCAVDEWS